MPWERKAVAFFGPDGVRPPELIIQDELHLISGALGSIVGLYEVGFDAVLKSRGVYPKIIASTATIRQAKEQIQSLFGREQMAIFPPVGLRQKDSYFAKEIPTTEKPGRMYVGYMAFSRKRVQSLIDLAGALLAAPKICFDPEIESEKYDAWWTQLIYHGSLKNVGISRTNFQSAIPRTQRLFLYQEIYKQALLNKWISNDKELREFIQKKGNSDTNRENTYSQQELTKLLHKYAPRFPNIKSLTSNQTSNENAGVFRQLKLMNAEKGAIDVVLATNMISVGLDEPRLALMIINGQPLTTAEYIQASSRVGRGAIPGIVFTNYAKTQAMSLSLYENFRSYHRSFYRFVEPSSLTPFTRQVRKRALHASLILAVRHMKNGLLDNNEAGNFSSDDPIIQNILMILKKRIQEAINSKNMNQDKTLVESMQDLDALVNEWQNLCTEDTNLRYVAHDKSSEGLLASFDQKTSNGLWPTLNSMRNIESTAVFSISKELINEK